MTLREMVKKELNEDIDVTMLQQLIKSNQETSKRAQEEGKILQAIQQQLLAQQKANQAMQGTQANGQVPQQQQTASAPNQTSVMTAR